MAIYLLVFSALALALMVLIASAAVIVRGLRRVTRIARFHAACDPPRVAVGGQVRVVARVVPRRREAIGVDAALTCTLFDQHAHTLFEHAVRMDPDGDGAFSAGLTVPSCAPGTGQLGADLSEIFSEDARRLLVVWSVVVTVRSAADTVLARRTLGLEVTGGALLPATAPALDEMVVGAFAGMEDALLFNWLTRAAATDGVIAPRERELLHHVLRATAGLADPVAADARIAAELEREMGFDARLIRRHVPAETRQIFCRLLFAVAWRDGALGEAERRYLDDKLGELGLTRGEARRLEREVLLDVAQRALA